MTEQQEREIKIELLEQIVAMHETAYTGELGNLKQGSYVKLSTIIGILNYWKDKRREAQRHPRSSTNTI